MNRVPLALTTVNTGDTQNGTVVTPAPRRERWEDTKGKVSLSYTVGDQPGLHEMVCGRDLQRASQLHHVWDKMAGKKTAFK